LSYIRTALSFYLPERTGFPIYHGGMAGRTGTTVVMVLGSDYNARRVGRKYVPVICIPAGPDSLLYSPDKWLGRESAPIGLRPCLS
jgi:hypothetical protein